MNSYQIITQYVNRDNRIPFDDKKDVIQSVYVNILEAQPKYVTRSYIRRTINHLLIDQQRANKARPTLVFSDVEYGSAGLLPDDKIDEIEKQLDILKRTKGAWTIDKHDIQSRTKRTKRAKRD